MLSIQERSTSLRIVLATMKFPAVRNNMIVPYVVVALLLLSSSSLLSLPPTDAFALPRGGRMMTTTIFGVSSSSSRRSNQSTTSSLYSTSAAEAQVVDVPTKPIQGMKPGTSGLRKKVEVWQGLVDSDVNKNYVENFIQSLIDTAADKNDGQKMPQT